MMLINSTCTINGEIPIKIGMKIDEIYPQNRKISFKYCKNRRKIAKNIDDLLFILEFGAVQRIANLVDLEKRCKMSIWLQKSASIQPRTSPLKFDEFLRIFRIWSGEKECESCRSSKMLKNEYLVAKIGFDTAEHEPSKV